MKLTTKSGLEFEIEFRKSEVENPMGRMVESMECSLTFKSITVEGKVVRNFRDAPNDKIARRNALAAALKELTSKVMLADDLWKSTRTEIWEAIWKVMRQP